MPQRVSAQEARQRLQGEDGALLVCAYNDQEKCRNTGIEEAIPYPELENRLEAIPKSKELIFFCA